MSTKQTSKAKQTPKAKQTRRVKKASVPRCPHCNAELKKWKVPQNIFTEWPNEYFYICMNDECSYFVQGWETMENQGMHGSYRLMYDPETSCCQPLPVMNKKMLRDQIAD
jgi:hypothetical protein